MEFMNTGHFGKEATQNREPPYNAKSRKTLGPDADTLYCNNQELPKVSPKFGNSGRTRNGQQALSQGNKGKRLYPSSAKNCFNNLKENAFTNAKIGRHFKENVSRQTKSKRTNEVSNSMLLEHNEEAVAKDCMNKSYEYKRRSHGHRHLGGYRALYESNNSRIPLDEAKNPEINTRNQIYFSKNIKAEGPMEAWKEKNDHEERAERIEVELKRIRKDPSSRSKIHSLFEEIIGCDQYYGKALKQIKEFYEWRICQLNERIGRHDMKCKEYKGAVERQKKLREEKERKVEAYKAEVQRQNELIEAQKEVIDNLKSKAESTPVANLVHNPNAKKNVLEKQVAEKVVVPRLDLSRLRSDLRRRNHKETEDPSAWNSNKAKNWKGANEKTTSNESIEVVTFKDSFIYCLHYRRISY
eukprot:TRINITY_DN5531_c0_g2_i1.p1 TRINITY_DN5531_c0_g2~~TRINITY_DN5531_c0_g2_i1.p1  ORF type:complete len:412 (-),score=66.40 TRINITY_DN5531_c0_g2_i1:86-1321(-)